MANVLDYEIAKKKNSFELKSRHVYDVIIVRYN